MNKEFIPYEQALELKELGFDEPCFATYEFGKIHINEFKNDCPYELCLKTKVFPATTFSQAFRWFREKYDLFGCIDLQVCTPSHWFIRIDKIEINDYLYHSEDEHLRFNTYEEAELACLKKLIEIVKSNKP